MASKTRRTFARRFDPADLIPWALALVGALAPAAAFGHGWSSHWRWAPKDRGYVFELSPEGGIAKQPGDRVTISGRLKATGNSGGQSVRNLLRDDDVSVRFFYPSYLTEVQGTIDSNGNVRFTTPPLVAGVSPSFIAQVSNAGERVERLERSRSKLERIIQRLDAKIAYLSGLPAGTHGLAQCLAELRRLRDRYLVFVARINASLDESPEILASYELSIQNGNLVSGPLVSSSIQGQFKYKITFDAPGSAIEGETTQAHGLIFSLREFWDSSSQPWPKWIGEFTWNNATQSQTARTLPGGESLLNDRSTGKLGLSASNTYEVELFKADSRGRKTGPAQGALSLVIPVADDRVNPLWVQAQATPSRRYTQNLEPVHAVAVDGFGLMDPASANASVRGTPVSGGSINQAIALTKSSPDQGQTLVLDGSLPALNEGDYEVWVQAADLSGLAAQPSPLKLPFSVDRTAPQIQLGIQDGLLTRNPSLSLPVTVVDRSPISVHVFLNGSEVGTGDLPTQSFSMLLAEGLNTLRVDVQDAAGNSSSATLASVVLDTIPPQLSDLIPPSGAIVPTLTFGVSGKANEPLSGVLANGQPLTLAGDARSFSGSYTVPNEGPVQIHFDAQDLAGNSSSANATFEVVLRVLNGSLLSVNIDPDGQHLNIVGAQFASRPGAQVSASGGFFNSASTVAGADGSFTLKLRPFSEALVTATDSILGRTDSATVHYGAGSPTLLSGVVKNTDGQPLPGVTVSLQGTAASTITDAQGAFQLSRSALGEGTLVTGDQVIVFDGSTAIQPPAPAPQVRYYRSALSVTVGLNQNNVLPAPVYMQGVPVDTVPIEPASGGVVTAANDPSVSLSIGAGVIEGLDPVAVFVKRVPADRTVIPVPDYAVPDTVIQLEPSGLKFNRRVAVSFPNENELEPGTQLVIMSASGEKGSWSIDGIAQVSDDGQSVRTLPGVGISHFSTIFPVPLGPKVAQIGAQDRPGADTFNGAVSTSISTPSFKSLGQDVAANVTYSSAAAKPTALVTNLFDIPDRKVDVSSEVDTDAGSLLLLLFSFGSARLFTNYKAMYVPDLITGRFDTAGISGTPVKWTGVPNRVALSYATELRDQATGDYLPTGIYPYASHWEVKLKHVLIKTHMLRFGYTLNVQLSTERTDTAIDQIFPSDLAGRILVQNDIKSPAGRGWRVGGAQRIVNPAANTILLEEADGKSATYAIDNTLDLVLDGAPDRISMTEGVDMSDPAHALVSHENGAIYQTDLTSAHPGLSLFASAIPVNDAGRIFGNYFHVDGFANAGYKCEKDFWEYQVRPYASQLFRTPDGKAYSTVWNLNALFTFAPPSYAQISGTYSTPRTLFGDNYRDQLTNYCAALPGMACRYGGNATTSGWPGYYGDNCHNTFSFGSYPAPGFNGDGALGNIQWNGPQGIAAGPRPNTLVIADTGNHRVRLVDLTTQTVTTIAGNGSYNPVDLSTNPRLDSDSGDGGAATAAMIYHPKGVIYDSRGNLFISDGAGRIRVVNSLGVISTLVGGVGATIRFDAPAGSMVRLQDPFGMVIDEVGGYLYVAETGANVVKRVNLVTSAVDTVAGNGLAPIGVDGNGQPIASIGTGGAALNATLGKPTYLGLDANRNLLIAESVYDKIRRVNFQNAAATTLAFAPAAQDNSKLIKNSDGTFDRKYRNGTVVHFAADGSQLQTLDRVGRTTTFEYDSFAGADRPALKKVTLPTGQWMEYGYLSGKLDSITDSTGRGQTKFGFTGDRLSSVIFPDNTSRSYQYDTSGLLTRETNERGVPTDYAYNEWNRVTTITRAAGTAEATTVVINDMGSATAGNKYTGTPGQAKSTTDGSAKNQLIDPNSRVTSVRNEASGFIAMLEDPSGKKIQFVRNERGQPVKVRRGFDEHDPNNLTDDTFESEAVFTYDDATGDLLTSRDTQTGVSESKTYDAFGNVLTLTNARGFTTTRTYHPSTGLLLTETDPVGRIASNAYFSNGVVSLKQTKVGATVLSSVSYGVDSNGNVTSQSDALNRTTHMTLDAAGNALTVKNALLKDTLYSFDAFNRLTSVTTPKNETTVYEYSKTGQLLSFTDPHSEKTTFEYNLLDQLVRKTDPLGFSVTRTYDKSGNVLTERDPNGNLKTFEYDERNQLKTKTLPDNLYEFTYNDSGKLLTAQDSATQATMVYDRLDRLTDFTFAGRVGKPMASYPGYSLVLSYDPAGNRTSITEQLVSRAGVHNGLTSYTFDPADRLKSLTNPKGELYSYTYLDADRAMEIARPGSVSRYEVDSTGFLTGLTHKKASTLENISAFSYGGNALNNRTRITRSLGSQSALDQILGYDDNQQLTSSQDPRLAGSFSNESFSYDKIGNRAADQQGSSSYDSRHQRLVEDYRYFYFFDPNGNLVSKQAKGLTGEVINFSYTSDNQLVKVVYYDVPGLDPSTRLFPAGTPQKEVLYRYSVTGHRIEKQVIDHAHPERSLTRRYAYAGDEVLAEYTVNDSGENVLLARYTHSGLRLDDILCVEVEDLGTEGNPMSQSPGTYQYLKDGLGSVTEVADNSGSLVQRYTYSVFGILLGIQDASGSDVTANAPLKTSATYTAREIDNETGLYYYRARYYDPWVGRFLQKDPEPGKLERPTTVTNSSVYVSNMPSSVTDPTGRFFLIPLLIAGLLVGATQVLTNGLLNMVQGKPFFEGALGAFIGGFISGFLGAGFGALAEAGATGLTAINLFVAKFVGSLAGMFLYKGLTGKPVTASDVLGAFIGGALGGLDQGFGIVAGIIENGGWIPLVLVGIPSLIAYEATTEHKRDLWHEITYGF